MLGSAAMLLWYDIVAGQVAEHDDWHTRQHFPERVGIPGFLRAQRWVSEGGAPRYFVVYEVVDLDVLSSAPYLERLNHPTPWTSRIMAGFRGMVRGFCALEGSHGSVLGASALTLRYSVGDDAEVPFRSWLAGELMPELMQRQGISSAFELRSRRAPPMTAEQEIRGRDASVDRVLLVTGYASDSIEALAQREVGADALERHGVLPGAQVNVFRLACLSDRRS